ncbi:unnamed protein product [Amoebophrya sp. A25]|nr:unnamed protein product [Amoebophrya sp. A25]|eukprot:GSA25T00013386001.1
MVVRELQHLRHHRSSPLLRDGSSFLASPQPDQYETSNELPWSSAVHSATTYHNNHRRHDGGRELLRHRTDRLRVESVWEWVTKHAYDTARASPLSPQERGDLAIGSRRASLVLADTSSGTDSFHYMTTVEGYLVWTLFVVFFLALIALDLFVLNAKNRKISLTTAALQTMFWMSCAGLFCFVLYLAYSTEEASRWLSGYLLEWMLSFDNLFVFQLIFRLHAVPEPLKHKPLIVGILGAIFFRLGLIAVGEFLVHGIWAAHIIFGLFLVYTGMNSIVEEEDDDEADPTTFASVKWLQDLVPFVGIYDQHGSFFMRVPVDKDGNAVYLEELKYVEPEVDTSTSEAEKEKQDEDEEPGGISAFFGRISDAFASAPVDEKAAPTPPPEEDSEDREFFLGPGSDMVMSSAPAPKKKDGDATQKKADISGAHEDDALQKKDEKKAAGGGMKFYSEGRSESGDESSIREKIDPAPSGKLHHAFAEEKHDSGSSGWASRSIARSGSAGKAAVPAIKEDLKDVDAGRGISIDENHPGVVGYETRATLLFLVVVCLEVCDLIFAVDSVSAIVAQIDDLFLAYTSTIFAMLGIRCLFFVVNALANLFSMLKYGVSLILILIGLKLVLQNIITVSPVYVCAGLLVILLGSILASVLKDRVFDVNNEEEEKHEHHQHREHRHHRHRKNGDDKDDKGAHKKDGNGDGHGGGGRSGSSGQEKGRGGDGSSEEQEGGKDSNSSSSTNGGDMNDTTGTGTGGDLSTTYSTSIIGVDCPPVLSSTNQTASPRTASHIRSASSDARRQGAGPSLHIRRVENEVVLDSLLLHQEVAGSQASTTTPGATSIGDGVVRRDSHQTKRGATRGTQAQQVAENIVEVSDLGKGDVGDGGPPDQRGSHEGGSLDRARRNEKEGEDAVEGEGEVLDQNNIPAASTAESTTKSLFRRGRPRDGVNTASEKLRHIVVDSGEAGGGFSDFSEDDGSHEERRALGPSHTAVDVGGTRP